MNTTDIEKSDTNNIKAANQRLITILLVLLIILLLLLVVGIVVVILMMSGGMMTSGMMGLKGQTMNNMITACTNMMQNLQKP